MEYEHLLELMHIVAYIVLTGKIFVRNISKHLILHFGMHEIQYQLIL